MSVKNSIYSLIYDNEPLRLWISAVTGRMVFPADFPIELREYGSTSRGMPCHSDIQMYSQAVADFEIVVTIQNRGDFEVIWYAPDGTKKSVRPKANSITIVKPGGAVHCVGPSGGGNREILKFIMVGSHEKGEEFAEYVQNSCYHNNPNVLAVSSKRRSHEPRDGEL